MDRANQNKENKIGKHYLAYMKEQKKMLNSLINIEGSTDSNSVAGPSNKKRSAKPRSSKKFSDILELEENGPSTSHSSGSFRKRAPRILKPKNELVEVKEENNPKVKKEAGKKRNARKLPNKENPDKNKKSTNADRSHNNTEDEIGNCYTTYLEEQREAIKNLLDPELSPDVPIAAEPNNENLPEKPINSKYFDDESDEDIPSPPYSPHSGNKKSSLIIRLQKKQVEENQAKSQKEVGWKKTKWIVIYTNIPDKTNPEKST